MGQTQEFILMVREKKKTISLYPCMLLFGFLISSNEPVNCACKDKNAVWIKTDVSKQHVDMHDLMTSQGKHLSSLIGHKVKVRGKFLDLGKGSYGLMDSGSNVSIAFEPISIPKNGELTIKYTVTKFRKNPNDFKAKVEEFGGNWYSKKTSPTKTKKLQTLTSSLKPNTYVTATGTLCHFKMITSGEYDLFPQVAGSHFFFSIDDLIIGEDNPAADFAVNQ